MSMVMIIVVVVVVAVLVVGLWWWWLLVDAKAWGKYILEVIMIDNENFILKVMNKQNNNE